MSESTGHRPQAVRTIDHDPGRRKFLKKAALLAGAAVSGVLLQRITSGEKGPEKPYDNPAQEDAYRKWQDPNLKHIRFQVVEDEAIVRDDPRIKNDGNFKGGNEYGGRLKKGTQIDGIIVYGQRVSVESGITGSDEWAAFMDPITNKMRFTHISNLQPILDSK